MAKLPITKVSAADAPLNANRVYRITPPVGCTVGIGSGVDTRVSHDHKYAQLRGGVTYEFVTSASDKHLTVLSRRDSGDLDYINDRPRPVDIP